MQIEKINWAEEKKAMANPEVSICELDVLTDKINETVDAINSLKKRINSSESGFIEFPQKVQFDREGRLKIKLECEDTDATKLKEKTKELIDQVPKTQSRKRTN
jgi:hypothetical protein